MICGNLAVALLVEEPVAAVELYGGSAMQRALDVVPAAALDLDLAQTGKLVRGPEPIASLGQGSERATGAERDSGRVTALARETALERLVAEGAGRD
jgi:hypothetical protein